MNKYRVLLKCGMVFEAESKWLDTGSIHHELCDREPFIKIGETVFAKDTIAMIEKIEETEKEN